MAINVERKSLLADERRIGLQDAEEDSLAGRQRALLKAMMARG